MKDFIVEPLAPSHILEPFNCGAPALDRWLKDSALRAQRQGSAQTRVLCRSNESVALGYFSITPTQVARETLPSAPAGGLSTIPAYLLARLALDRSLQGQGLGADLLGVALRNIVAASALAGGRLIVVDAIDSDAVNFYQHHGFTRIGASNRLYTRIAGLAIQANQLADRSTPPPS